MSFFDRSTAQSRIEIDRSSASASSPELAKRLTRIAGNYQRLDAILTELEAKFEFDDRLAGDVPGKSIRPIKPR